MDSDNSSIGIAADDCFVVIDLATHELAPNPASVAALAATLAELEHWEVIWDLRGTGGALYDDIVEAYRAGIQMQSRRPTALIPPDHEPRIDEWTIEEILGRVPRSLQPKLLPTRAKPLDMHSLDLTLFSEGWAAFEGELFTASNAVAREVELARDPVVARERNRRDLEAAIALGLASGDHSSYPLALEARELMEMFRRDEEFIHKQETARKLAELEADVQAQRREVLGSFLDRIASNSLLAQVAFLVEGDRIRVIPLHANALHRVDCNAGMLAVRPARRGAPVQWRRFSGAISELEDLINRPDTREAEIEGLLRRHPLFLRGLNYAHAYHQVVLPMGDGRSLRPDIIVEPVSAEWADVIDLKLPQEPVFVGSGERVHLSQAIARAASQLRQYSRWFDDREVSRKVEARYGFRCFKPRQVVIIGRDPRQFNEAQREAARSAYPDLEIVTYDRLLRVARQQLLF